MASQQTKSSRAKATPRTSKDVKAPQRGERKGRRASEKSGKYRFAHNVAEAGTPAEREYEAYALSDMEDPRGDPEPQHLLHHALAHRHPARDGEMRQGRPRQPQEA